MRPPADRLIVTPAERRLALLQVIDSARHRLMLSPGECDDRRVFDAIHAAVGRGVRVEALLARGAKWRSSPTLLRLLLERLGVRVWRYDGPHGKYHAKYAISDDAALVGSLNFTRWCFKRTCDFLLVTHDQDVVSGLTTLFETDSRAPASAPLPRLSPRIIVGPDLARAQIERVLERARRGIRLIDPKPSDSRMLAMLRAKASSGTSVTILRHAALDGLAPHGKLLLVDDELAMVGSMALTSSNLDRRREIGITVTDRRIVRQLLHLFDDAAPACRVGMRALRSVEAVA